jgi:peptidoglycan/LPS O-acetylase OafA/YrhL
MNKEDRLTQLDALRGLAALAVFWHHAFCMMPTTPVMLERIGHTPLHFIYDGTSAVLLFFVLSGFVLNLRYAQASEYPPHWVSTFLIRRFFRIYPAFFVAIGLGLLLRHFLYDPSASSVFSDWFSTYWRHPMVLKDFVRMLTLISPGFDISQIDPPMWSLQYEMRISLFFPLVIWITNRKRKPAGDLILMAAVYATVFFFRHNPNFLYLPMFVLGAICAKHINWLKSTLSRASRLVKVAWMVAALLLYQVASFPDDYAQTVFHLNNYLLDQIVGLGAAGFIVGCVALVRIKTLLNQHLFQFLGQTSYSFYLFHLVLLLGLAPLIHRATHSLMVCWFSVLALSYLLSILIFEALELPLIRQGNKAAAAFVARFQKGNRVPERDF